VADNEHIARLKQGVAAWNAWRREEGAPPYPDLSHANLRNAELSPADLLRTNLNGANLRGADLHDANLHRANLSGANLRGANLSKAHLIGANLGAASLHIANLRHANLGGAELLGANLNMTDLIGANLTKALLGDTVLANIDLTSVIGLETCIHIRPSSIDHQTLEKSRQLPLPFLRGVGLPDRLIKYLPSIFNQAMQYYSCFISYSTNDQEFADRIYADLQNRGVRCWFAPHDMRIGGKILDEIDAAIRQRDKLLLILSEHSIKSDWVEDEVTTAFEEERKRGRTVLFPIRLDDAIMDTNEAWAKKLRARHIGDLRCWTDHSCYMTSFERLMRNLTSE
jgi:uncharacterized protein YjbI with pentapeptide repeats